MLRAWCAECDRHSPDGLPVCGLLPAGFNQGVLKCRCLDAALPQGGSSGSPWRSRPWPVPPRALRSPTIPAPRRRYAAASAWTCRRMRTTAARAAIAAERTAPAKRDSASSIVATDRWARPRRVTMGTIARMTGAPPRARWNPATPAPARQAPARRTAATVGERGRRLVMTATPPPMTAVALPVRWRPATTALARRPPSAPPGVGMGS